MNGQNKSVLCGWLLMALLPLLVGGVDVGTAQTPRYEQAPPVEERGKVAEPMETQAEFRPNLERANELIGAKVVNHRQEKLGSIEDIVLNPDRTAVSYAALSHGGLWGWGGKLFAVPWSQFEASAKDNILVLKNVTPADLENAKGFDKKHWPMTASENWLGRDLTPAGSEPADMPEHREQAEGERMLPRSDRSETPGIAGPATAEAGIRYRRLSQLVGLTIKNNAGEELGELENLVIDLHEGKVAFAVLSMRSGFLNLRKDLAIVPWSSFEIVPRLGTARLNADKETLQAIAFDEDEFPNLEDAQYSRQIHERFGARPYWETLGFVPGAREPREREEREETLPGATGTDYESLYNPDTIKTIHGTITSVGTFRMPGTPVDGLRLRLKTGEGETVTVHVGPRPYVEDRKFDFHYGDELTVTGSSVESDWREFIVASQIKKGDKTLDLRTSEGKPRWSPNDLKESR